MKMDDRLSLNMDGRLSLNMDGRLSLNMDGRLSLNTDGRLLLSMDGRQLLSMDGRLLQKMDGRLSLKIDGRLSLKMDGRLSLVFGYIWTLNIYNNRQCFYLGGSDNLIELIHLVSFESFSFPFRQQLILIHIFLRGAINSLISVTHITKVISFY